jgi:glycerol-3-phosphate dehydrogenase
MALCDMVMNLAFLTDDKPVASLTLAAAPAVARLIAPHLGWDDAETQRQVQAFVASCADEAAAGSVTEAEFIASVRGAS